MKIIKRYFNKIMPLVVCFFIVGYGQCCYAIKPIGEYLKNEDGKFSVVIKGEKICLRDMEQITMYLRANPMVTELYILMSAIENDAIKNLAVFLQDNESISSLSLADDGIGGEAAKIIAEVLKSNKAIVEFWLYGNDIRDIGAIAIARALLVNSSITSVDLIGNNISAAGAIELANMLRMNRTLISLVLHDNPVVASALTAFANALRINTSITSFSYANPNIIDQIPELNEELFAVLDQERWTIINSLIEKEMIRLCVERNKLIHSLPARIEGVAQNRGEIIRRVERGDIDVRILSGSGISTDVIEKIEELKKMIMEIEYKLRLLRRKNFNGLTSISTSTATGGGASAAMNSTSSILPSIVTIGGASITETNSTSSNDQNLQPFHYVDLASCSLM